jgi:hypothetical protein
MLTAKSRFSTCIRNCVRVRDCRGILARKGWHISELIARAKGQIAVDQMAGRSKAVEIEITQLVDQDKWWTRPAGVVALSVIGGVIAGVLAILIAQIIMLKLGLVH